MGITIDLLSEARKRNKLAEQDEGIKYIRFREEFRSIARGTVIIKPRRIIWGFPHIKRIFTLEKGIERNIKAETFYAEEKIDGFNLRVAKVNGNLFAFSRGGFVDWFSTEKIREMGLEDFFDDYPNCILCGEMIGNTPYTQPTAGFDVKLFVFDIDEGDGSYLKPKDKYGLLRKYGIESVPLLGTFRKNELAKIKQLALMLLKRKKEGMVIKSENRSDIVKYVTPYADIDDIYRNMALLFDMPAGFFIQRVLRSAFFIKDFQLDRDDYGRELGLACYNGLMERLSALEGGGRAAERYEILIKNEETWGRILKHMTRDVKIEIISRKVENKGTRIKFRKIYKKSDRLLRRYLEGVGITD